MAKKKVTPKVEVGSDINDELLELMASEQGSGTKINIPTDRGLNCVSEMVNEVLRLQNQLEQLDLDKKNLETQLRGITHDSLPNLMRDLGVESFELTDGSTVSVVDMAFANFTEEHKQEAFKWLRDNEFGDLIKNTVSAKFGRGEENKARELQKHLLAIGANYETKEKIEPQTLKAFTKEYLDKERRRLVPMLPREVFAVFEITEAKIKAPKKKKA